MRMWPFSWEHAIPHQTLPLLQGMCSLISVYIFITVHVLLCSYCNGNTLYQHLHIFGEKFLSTKCVNIARQVSQVRMFPHVTVRSYTVSQLLYRE